MVGEVCTLSPKWTSYCCPAHWNPTYAKGRRSYEVGPELKWWVHFNGTDCISCSCQICSLKAYWKELWSKVKTSADRVHVYSNTNSLSNALRVRMKTEKRSIRKWLIIASFCCHLNCDSWAGVASGVCIVLMGICEVKPSDTEHTSLQNIYTLGYCFNSCMWRAFSSFDIIHMLRDFVVHRY